MGDECEARTSSGIGNRYSKYVNEKHPVSLVDRMIAMHEENERNQQPQVLDQQASNSHEDRQNGDSFHLTVPPITNQIHDKQRSDILGLMNLKAPVAGTCISQPRNHPIDNCQPRELPSCQTNGCTTTLADQTQKLISPGSARKTLEADVTFCLGSKRKFNSTPSEALQMETPSLHIGSKTSRTEETHLSGLYPRIPELAPKEQKMESVTDEGLGWEQASTGTQFSGYSL